MGTEPSSTVQKTTTNPGPAGAATGTGNSPVIIAALPTPFEATGAVHTSTYRKLLHRLEPWVDGVLVAGTTAEFLTLTDSERAHLSDEAIRVFGPERTIVHVGAASLGQVTHLAATARQSGAYRFAALTPFYFDYTTADVIAFFHNLRQQLSEDELYGYFFAERTGITLTPTEIAKIVSIATLDGIKISGNIWRDLPRIRTEVGDHLPIYTGHDHDPILTQQLGATGVISGLSCLRPELFRNLDNGEVESPSNASQISDLAIAAGRTLPDLKAALALTVPGSWSMRIPIAPAEPPAS